MKSMNLFDRKGESSKALFGDSTSKETIKPKKKVYSEDFKKEAVKLAYKVGVTKAAEELGVSTSSLYSWKKISAEKSLAKKLSSAPIQDENGNLTFELEGKTYSLNVNSSEEREIIKAEVNSNSVAKYDWFKEGTGKEHWVLYNTEMYEIRSFCNIVYLHYIKNSNLTPTIPINATFCNIVYLHYIKNSNLTPTIPINATSCYKMFYNCESLTQLDLSNFNTSNVVNMSEMFSDCLNLMQLDLSNFDTSQVTSMCNMFCSCEAVTQLDFSSFNTSKVTDMSGMFFNCKSLKMLDLSNFDISSIHYMNKMFCYCYNLTTIYISNEWNTGSIDRFDDMLSHCFATIKLK